MNNNPDSEKIYLKLREFASYKPRSLYEVEAKFKRVGSKCSDEVKQKAFDKLREDGLLDEEKNIAYYMQGFLGSSKPRSARVIKNYFLKKSFDPLLVEMALQSIPADQEEANIKRCIDRKIRQIFAYPAAERRNRLIKYLLAKGYSYNVICSVVDTTSGLK